MNRTEAFKLISKNSSYTRSEITKQLSSLPKCDNSAYIATRIGDVYYYPETSAYGLETENIMDTWTIWASSGEYQITAENAGAAFIQFIITHHDDFVLAVVNVLDN